MLLVSRLTWRQLKKHVWQHALRGMHLRSYSSQTVLSKVYVCFFCEVIVEFKDVGAAILKALSIGGLEARGQLNQSMGYSIIWGCHDNIILWIA